MSYSHDSDISSTDSDSSDMSDMSDSSESSGSDLFDLVIDQYVKKAWNDSRLPSSPEPLRNKDGTIRKRNRIDYSRSKKARKSENPYKACSWLQLLHNPLTRDPTSRSAKLFRRKFRVPHPVFMDILDKVKSTGEKEFAVLTEPLIGGEMPIPLELKLLSALRILGK